MKKNHKNMVLTIRDLFDKENSVSYLNLSCARELCEHGVEGYKDIPENILKNIDRITKLVRSIHNVIYYPEEHQFTDEQVAEYLAKQKKELQELKRFSRIILP